jgi:hypothetical protein
MCDFEIIEGGIKRTGSIYKLCYDQDWVDDYSWAFEIYDSCETKGASECSPEACSGGTPELFTVKNNEQIYTWECI